MSDNDFLNTGLDAVTDSYISGVKDTTSQIYPLAGILLKEGDGRLMGKCNSINSSVKKKEKEIAEQRQNRRNASNQ